MFSKDFFATRLSALRKEANISGRALAAEIGVSQQSVSQFESGSIYPHANTLVALADYFDVSLDYLVGRSDDPHRY